MGYFEWSKGPVISKMNWVIFRKGKNPGVVLIENLVGEKSAQQVPVGGSFESVECGVEVRLLPHYHTPKLLTFLQYGSQNRKGFECGESSDMYGIKIFDKPPAVVFFFPCSVASRRVQSGCLIFNKWELISLSGFSR